MGWYTYIVMYSHTDNVDIKSIQCQFPSKPNSLASQCIRLGTSSCPFDETTTFPKWQMVPVGQIHYFGGLAAVRQTLRKTSFHLSLLIALNHSWSDNKWSIYAIIDDVSGNHSQQSSTLLKWYSEYSVIRYVVVVRTRYGVPDNIPLLSSRDSTTNCKRNWISGRSIKPLQLAPLSIARSLQ